MAKLFVSSERAEDWLKTLGDDVYLKMIEQLSPLVAEALVPKDIPDVIRKKLLAKALEDNEWSMTLMSKNGQGVVNITGPNFTMRRIISQENGAIIHAFFEVGSKLQGGGISNIVLDTTVKVADALSISKVALHANLDVGGYAWLRKGFFPSSIEKLMDSAVSGNALLLAELRASMSTMSLETARNFVLTDGFKKYKKLFLGASWEGSADLTSEITRTAFVRGAAEASKLINSRNLKKILTYNEQILDNMVRHQTYLLRYGANVTNESVALLKATEASVRALVLKYADDYIDLDGDKAASVKLFKTFESDVSAARSKAWDAIGANAYEEFQRLTVIEGAAVLGAIQSPFPITLGLQALSTRQMKAILDTTPFEGRTLKEWLARSQITDADRISATARAAVIAGQTPSEVARSAMGTSSLNFKDSHARRSFKDLESIYLTVTNGISNQVKQEFYEANSDIVKNELYVATLDIGTTVMCAGNDGKIFARGTGPIPPLHFRCRSLRVAYIDGEVLLRRGYDASSSREFLDEFAKENNLGKVSSYKDLPRGYKGAYNAWARIETRKRVGQVPALQNFNEFLNNQSETFQNEYLGKSRADIFRQGKLSLDKFTTANGYELTIAELEKLSNAA
jgi:hypothetical protein